MLILSPSYFALILLNCPPRLFSCLTEQRTVAFRSKFILPSGWVCVCLETELCLWVLPPWNTGQCAGVTHSYARQGWPVGTRLFFFFHSKASPFYFILFYFEILKKLLNLESEFPAASMWMYVTFPSLLVRTLWPKVSRHTSFRKLFSLLNF